jgi:hypothetical protein
MAMAGYWETNELNVSLCAGAQSARAAWAKTKNPRAPIIREQCFILSSPKCSFAQADNAINRLEAA